MDLSVIANSNRQKSPEIHSSPGFAVAFYKEGAGKREEDCSSFTTDITNTEASIDVSYHLNFPLISFLLMSIK